MPDIDELCREYHQWNEANGLKLGSADEHVNDETLTEIQRAWLARFIARWDAACEEEAAYAEAEREAFGHMGIVIIDLGGVSIVCLQSPIEEECDHQWEETEEDFYVCKRCNARSGSEECKHEWVENSDEQHHGEGRIYCQRCGKDGDA
jgi:hypothetical protein